MRHALVQQLIEDELEDFASGLGLRYFPTTGKDFTGHLDESLLPFSCAHVKALQNKVNKLERDFQLLLNHLNLSVAQEVNIVTTGKQLRRAAKIGSSVGY